MARARNIKPGFYKNEDLAECSIWARFIFPGLWMLADREGRLEDRPKRIKAELLPFDGEDVDALLAELQARGFLIRYRNEYGAFIQISAFKKHQTPHYSEKQSAIKPPQLQEDSKKPDQLAQANTPRELQESSGSDTGLKRGSQPPDSLNPDSLNPDSPKRAERSQGSRLPQDWQPDEELLGWAKEKRPDLNLADTVLRFSNHWHSKPGKDGRKLDWRRTFQNWVLAERVQPGARAHDYSGVRV